MTSPTPEQLAKLPKWAQDHISTLDVQRRAATKALNEALEAQPDSVYSTSDVICDVSPPRFITRKIAATYGIVAKVGDLEVTMRVLTDGSGVSIKASSDLSNVGGAFVPHSHGELTIIPYKRW